MPSPSLDNTHGRTTLGETCHHRLWTAHTVERRWACHAIIELGPQTRLNIVGRGMPSLRLDSRHGRATSGVKCHHLLWTANTVERRRAWHAIIAFGQHTRLDDVGRGTPSSPLGSTESQTMSGVECHYRPWTVYMVGRRRAWNAITSLGKHTRSIEIGRGMTSPPLDSTDGGMTLDVA